MYIDNTIYGDNIYSCVNVIHKVLMLNWNLFIADKTPVLESDTRQHDMLQCYKKHCKEIIKNNINADLLLINDIAVRLSCFCTIMTTLSPPRKNLS